MTDTNKSPFEQLRDLCSQLRGENGCLWDKEQTHLSLIPCLEEESQEVVEAINSGTDNDLKEELGDLLYQVIFHAQIAEEDGLFDINDVIKGLIEKLVRRHPHIFSDTKVESVDDIVRNWAEIKKEEKKNK